MGPLGTFVDVDLYKHSSVLYEASNGHLGELPNTRDMLCIHIYKWVRIFFQFINNNDSI